MGVFYGKLVRSSPFVFISVAYTLLLYVLSRFSIWFSTVLIVATPIILMACMKPRRLEFRIVQLVCIEYVFMISVTLGLLGVQFKSDPLKEIAFIGFCTFFVIQALGFMIDCIKKREILAILCTIICITTIFLWIGLMTSRRLEILDDNMIAVFGSPAPYWVIVVYFFWFLVVVSTGRVLPNLAEFFVHAVSIAVSALSGAFFFVRLLSASNLLLLDVFLSYTRRGILGSQYLRMSDRFYQERWGKLKLQVQLGATMAAFITMLFGFNVIFSIA